MLTAPSGFDPRLVYETVYQTFVLQALRTICETPTAERQSQRLRCQFENLALASTNRSVSTARVHDENIKKKILQWSVLRSNKTCLSCLRRQPEHTSSCGHASCDVCIQLFGKLLPLKEYRYHVERCVLCGVGSLTVNLKPPTAGVRILTIDGGGIRGVIPLEFLRILQELVGPDCPIQDLFDLAFGTSSGELPSIKITAEGLTNSPGGLIVLSLFIRRWDVKYCTRIFDTLTRQIFRRRTNGHVNFFQRVRHVLRCWLLDGHYDVRALEESLKENFGLEQRMFDYTGNASDTKVAVTATTISDASAYLFSTYNNSSVRSKDCGEYGRLNGAANVATKSSESGYKHLRPERIEDEPHVWEA